MTKILGISAGFHDAAATIIDDSGNILFAAHSERYSKVKNDPFLHVDLIREIETYEPDVVAYYERPWLHNLQQIISGQRDFRAWTTRGILNSHLGPLAGQIKKSQAWSHHLSHAAAGFQTSPFDDAAVLVVDAIGELDTISIYHARYDEQGRAKYRRIWRQSYPHSIGLFYSAVTDKIGLKPMDEEYITMGMAAFGSSSKTNWFKKNYLHDENNALFKKNFHTGLAADELPSVRKEDIAASAQNMVEQLIRNLVVKARSLVPSDNLVYMGGVALNCVANSKLGSIYSNIWIMPNPGDAGSSLGAAALTYGQKLNWQNAFLGYEITGPYPVKDVCDVLEQHSIVGVASGRAEFGPRALGNRSLLADPRGTEIKDRVNEIKRRQKFRPFAPVILEEHADKYFHMPPAFKVNRYMQAVAVCRRPDLYPAICHVDDTSRVQTVPQDGTGIRQLLEEWYRRTGCPMLLNTSLNVRGEPIVNDIKDARRFQATYKTLVCT